MSSSDLQILTTIATLVQTFFFIISVFFVGYQIQQHNRITRAANTQSLLALSAPFLLQLSQDRKLAELWITGTKQYETFDEVEQFQYLQLLFSWLNHHENIFYQAQSGLVDRQSYRGWQVELHNFIREKQIGRFWEKEMKRFFRPEFRHMVTKLIELG